MRIADIGPRAADYSADSEGSQGSESPIDNEGRTGDVARGRAGEEEQSRVDLAWVPDRPSMLWSANIFSKPAAFSVISLRKNPGRSALTRTPRRNDHCCAKSRVNPRTPALLAA